MDTGASNINKKATRFRISHLLQSRYCQHRIKNCHRSGRSFAQFFAETSARQEKNITLGIIRVDSVEIYQQGSNGRFAELCPDGYVYNVEVETYGTYIANGIAVHNCHHATAKTWRNVIDAYPNAYVVGLTATPARLGGQGLGDVFDSLVIGPTAKELIQQGHLAPYRYFAPPQVADLSGIKIKLGDYDNAELAIRMDKPAIIGDAISHYQRLAAGKRAIVYCASVDHSKNTAAAFQAVGIPSMHIDGTTPAGTRRQAIADFKTGNIRILSNVDLVGEGLDVPGCEAVVLLRPTASLTLYLQQSMRGMRPDKENPGKCCVILDHVGNAMTHGLPDEPREWSLEGIKKRSRDTVATIGARVCMGCYAVIKPKPVCEYCGYVFNMTPRQLAEEAGELVQFTAIEKKNARMQVGMARTIADLKEIAAARNYKPGWIWQMARLKGIKK